MTQTLLEEIKSFILRNELTQVGDVAHEQEANTKAALRRIIPLVVNGFIELSEQVGGREVVWSMAREAFKSGVLTNPGPALSEASVGPDRGANLLKSLLNDRYQGAVLSISTATGIQATSVVDLINVVVPVALALLGQQVDEYSWGADALSQWLQDQRGQHPAQVVAPLPVATPSMALAGIGPPHMHGGSSPGEASTSRWLWVALVVAASVIGYLLGHKPEAAPGVATTAGTDNFVTSASAAGTSSAAVAGHYDKASGNYIYDTGLPIVLKLKDGSRQMVGASSTENKLYQFLTNPEMLVDSVNRTKGWIGFDRIYFEPGKTTLTGESLVQLENVANILKSFPSAKVKIGGYTDTSGDAVANLKLSDDRARMAMATLINMGIETGRVEAKGYGDKHNIASNNTEEGRALNRRVSLRVTRK